MQRVCLGVLWSLTLSMLAGAQSPERINYQGRLINGTNLVSAAVPMVFRLYPQPAGGNPLYQETQTVTIVDGLYSVLIGEQAPAPGALFAALTNDPVYIEVEANGAPLTPRQRVASVAYAFNADKLDGFSAAAFATGTPLYVETDPVWTAQRSGYATGTPLYVEIDPVWNAEKAGYATTSALGAEAAARGAADGALSNGLSALDIRTVQTETGKVSRTGDSMSGPLTIQDAAADNALIIGSTGEVVQIGREADGAGLGTAVGYGADGSETGVAVGVYALGYNEGVAVGWDARGAHYGAGVGYMAYGQNEGAALGYGADGMDYGAAVGMGARGAGGGAAIGRAAFGESMGVAIGYYSRGRYGNIAVGPFAQATGLAQIAIGQFITNEVDHSAALRGTLYLDGGTAVLYRAAFGTGDWVNLIGHLATGTPLYTFTEIDPVWGAEKAGYATGTPIYVETDPVWVADQPGIQSQIDTKADSNLVWGTFAPQAALAAEQAARVAADAALSNQMAGKLESNYWAAADATTNYVKRTGDTMSGRLTINVGAGNILQMDNAGTGIQIGNAATALIHGVAVGYDANAYDSGAAVGSGARGNHGVAVGVQANGENGVAVGGVAAGSSYGTAVGASSRAANGGAALGYDNDGRDYGVAAGAQAVGRDFGVALGHTADAPFGGIAIGRLARAAMTNIAIGWKAVASGGRDRIAIGREVINSNDQSVAVRGTLYLDGGTGIYYRAAFGAGNWSNALYFAGNGNIGIGEPNPTNCLAVNGSIKAREVIVSPSDWSDFVFAPDYRRLPLAEVERYVQANGHLPGIPSAAQVAAGGINVGDMQARLLQKIEELTLELIDLRRENAALQRRLDALEAGR